jgi:cell division control protein 6
MFRKTESYIVKDPRVFDFNYVPEYLPHREEQMKRLSALFSPVLDSPVSQTAFFYGPVGSGKTCMAHRFCEDFKAAGKGTKAIGYKIVNCRDKDRNYKVLYEMTKTFQPAIRQRGYSVTEAIDIFRKDLKKRKMHFIVILDEADVLLRTGGDDLIYQLTRFDEEKSSVMGSVSLILISTQNVLDMLRPASLSTFKKSNVVKFGSYGQKELRDIARQRVDLGFHSNAITDEGIDMVAHMAAETGDARRVIELLGTAASYAQEAGAREISDEHIRMAKAQVAKYPIEELISGLNKHQLMALLGIARGSRRKSVLRMGEAEKNYHVVCEELGENHRSHTTFWKYITAMTHLGIIDSVQSGPGITGSTTLISLHEIPAEILVEELEARLFRKS